MTLTWAALGAALLLLPGLSPASTRAQALAGRGRLAAGVLGGTRHAVPPRAVALAGCCLVALGAGAAGGVVLGLAAAIASATTARLVLGSLSRRSLARARSELLAAVRLLTAELDSGATPAVGFAAAAEVAKTHAPALREAARRCAGGDDPHLDSGPLEGLGHAWRLASSAGAPLAAVCGRVADDLAARVEQGRAVASGVAGARASAAMLAGLPVLGVLLGSAMQAHPVEILFTTPSGRLVCLAGVTLDAVGLLWTQWLTARAAGP